MEKNHIKKHWKDYIIGLLVILFLGSFIMNSIGLSSTKSLAIDSSYNKGYNQVMESSYYYDSVDFAPQIEERKVIKNANLYLESNNYLDSKSQIQNSITAHNVIILSENEREYKENYKLVDYRLKVQSEKLDTLLDELKTYGEVTNVNVYTNDITGTYADYTSRIQRYETQIEKYEDLLKKETTIEEEIQIQQRIDQLEDQIFYLNDRISNLDEDVSYSDVYLSLKEKPSTLAEIDFLGLKDGFKLFMQSLESGIQFILLLIGFILPFGIIYGIYRGLKRLF